MPREQVGIRDVAAAAGVSVTTVSHVLNDTPHTRTSEHTKARVRAAAAELGYQPNRLARGLRTRASGMVGLLTEEIATTPHAGRIILGAQEEASRRGLTLAIINSRLNTDPEVETPEVQAFIDRQADGIIYATVYHDEVVTPDELHVVPAVLIGARDREGEIPSVMPDERGGAASVVDLLVRKGHRRIAFAATSVDVPATRGRLQGYRDGMLAAGLDPDEFVVEAVSEASGGYEATIGLLDHGRDPATRPTAVFCYNDRMAMGAYRAAAELGLQVPADVSIVGFDDQDPIAESLFPALTTVALPHYEMGAWAVRTVASLIEGRDEVGLLGAHPVLLDCPIVERASVAPPRA
ncbi:LacI family DNA-binding transcriptional regulator [Agromyces albus]|uniref:LacI family DNA-binding transcriptional regulator n=1 Tax=Agromyces albus TaxID=205332 RepID=A0A4Q2KTF0_9MICO|nr:LacI family DNA-binding transcriptional regulator [Agromyces albus]RXZ68007.1 LacI family DNA-binding transcriptional regulator [Agromyces albus]